jgi:hypothetical protein
VFGYIIRSSEATIYGKCVGRRRIIPRAVSRPTTYDLLPGSQNRDGETESAFVGHFQGSDTTTRALNAGSESRLKAFFTEQSGLG